MLEKALAIIGRLLAYSPQGCVAVLCWLLGHGVYWGSYKRRRLMLRNLHHAFPAKSEAWRRHIARTSCCRMIEMGTLALATPYFSPKRARQLAKLPPQTLDQLTMPQGRVILVPHFTLAQMTAYIPSLIDEEAGEACAIYRPLKNPAIDAIIRRSREHFGLQLFSRKAGFSQAIKLLQRGGHVAILFDQNAGHRGGLTTFFDRVAAMSELPGLLAQKCSLQAVICYPQRQGFWHATILAEPLIASANATTVNLAAQQWLENKLRTDETACADWLWLHDRWRTQDEPQQRLRLHAQRNRLPATLAFRHQQELPRNEHFFIRLPNWLGDIVMALPLIRTLRLSRPDAAITLLAQTAFVPWLQQLHLAEHIIALPPKRPFWRYCYKLWQLRQRYPNTQLLLTNSIRGDLEAWLIGAPQRFGMGRPGQKRPLLTHLWAMPDDLDETTQHQTRVWERYWRSFGLQGELDCRPFPLPAPPATTYNANPNHRLGLICGTENTPAKRWPIVHWRALLHTIQQHYSDITVYLFGTLRDCPITDAVAQGFAPEQVVNRAGQTNLLEFAQELRACHSVICNDTGGMHLANALGVPVIAIYGPTNPIRTGPIFTAPATIVQPIGCPITGGAPIDQVSPEQVLHAWENSIAKMPTNTLS